ncbi:alpha amylase C-terminal domain-containing protein [Halosquirtibacter xylanolyticus]|uniref:alpha amylase C-terminal domain-containing protein n=1 Tax=Halosquirtibacter xylanolyticus TaxID=3374599 RepID=UPI003748D840|nr:alpha amylase C-terminal domain-containing protein [Prolixibacteraceae bacterium]
MKNSNFVTSDPWLAPYAAEIDKMNAYCDAREEVFLNGMDIRSFARGYDYYGIHRFDAHLVIREWAPNAKRIFLLCDKNNWTPTSSFEFTATNSGNWIIQVPQDSLPKDALYALWMEWEGGAGRRIPAWAQYVVQDEETLAFSAKYIPPTTYEWKHTSPSTDEPALIYEAHVGMSGPEEKVHSYDYFTDNVLPRIHRAGYNVVQLMAIPEHPYYGSFGYHVSNFYAPSSRFGSPDSLRRLIDTAHGLGMSVIMDLVHSHAVKNEVEGLGKYDGSQYQFFHDGNRGLHPAWDSMCFDYAKSEVVHFLLSNIQYWMEMFRFDGFRFDGVTSMLYQDHGLERAFTEYNDYYNGGMDWDALAYLRMANKLVKAIHPNALSIAEEMSGLPGLAGKISEGGYGFDYRMAMGVPDFWIRMIKDTLDPDWSMGEIFHQLTSHREEEKVVSYVESHDQAMVGDKTIIFRLLDKTMYDSMRKDQPSMEVDRGVALHKMIRLATITTAGGAYLNFMGNEFGHPEWIDFPREGNNWSYHHARRQWELMDNTELKFHWLGDFDRDMVNWVEETQLLRSEDISSEVCNEKDKVLVYRRGGYLFLFNFHYENSYDGYSIPVTGAKYNVVLHTDAIAYGGFNRVDTEMSYYAMPNMHQGNKRHIKIYLPSRTALVLKESRF